VSDKPRKVKVPGSDYSIHLIGVSKTPLRDFYHWVLRLNWALTFVMLAVFYLAANALFALGYLWSGGLANAHGRSFADAFYFSVQTMGTIGYGAISPSSTAANLLVVAESITGLILTALATGIVFAKFSRPHARIAFTRQVVISPMNGVPTLSFRVGNERGNVIVDAHIRVVLTRTEHTTEGKTYYRMYDLKLVRDRALNLTRSLSAMHVVDENSPLFGVTEQRLQEQEIEISAQVVGLDDISGQTMHGSVRWATNDIRLNVRHVDIIHEPDPQTMVVDLRKFHDLEPA
jgi:inward rectifier potassium channel